MSLYLGENLVSGISSPVEPTRNVGQIIQSTIPLIDAGLHLLDGSIISGEGIYKDFYNYIASLYESDPTASYFSQEYTETTYNYIEVGSLTNNNGVLRGFSSSNYFKVPNTLSTTSTNVILTTKVNISNFHSTYNDVFKPSSTNCPVGFDSTGKLGMYSTSSWLLGSTIYTTNTDIWVRVVWDGSSYKIYGLIDNNYSYDTLPDVSSWTLEATWTTTTNIWTQELYFGNSNTTTSEYLGGTLDLSETYIYVDNSLFYEGTTYIIHTSEQVWQSSVTNYGVCGKFVYDSVNNTVRLPKITGFIESTTDLTTLGELTIAGLPNITGTFQDGNEYGSTDQMSGAFYRTALGGHTPYSGNGSPNRAGFDASLSNPIYGRSDTVQPQSVKVLYYIVIATTTKTDIEVNVDQIASDLHNKVDKNDLISVHCVIETYVNGDSWYRVWSDGWCEQGGAWGSNVSGWSEASVIFLKSFSNTNYQLFVQGNWSDAASSSCKVTARSTTGFTGTYANNLYSAMPSWWYACGYI